MQTPWMGAAALTGNKGHGAFARTPSRCGAVAESPMKPCEFDYLRAATIDEACRALDGAGGEARIIAGGQTLVPLMAMRLARPSLLVDINHIAELSFIAEGGELFF